MDPLLTLFALWWASTRTSSAAKGSTAPAWPTPKSPPPIPAFKPKATPTPPTKAQDAAHPATPLAALHAKPPAPPPVPHAPPKAPPAPPPAPRITPGVLTSTVPVSKLQKVLLARGQKVVPDGKYGPRTAAAWSKLANAKKLPGAISRKGPTTAQVVTHTFDALSMPAIP